MQDEDAARWDWRVLEQRRVLQDEWISVRADRCVTPTGVEIAPYYVLEYRDFAHVLALDEAGRIVMIRQYRHGAGTLSLELPGGVVDPQDASPLQAALRELREETGYFGGEARHLATLSVDPAKLSNRLHLILATGLRPGPAAPEAGEDGTVVVLDRQKARRLAHGGGILSAAHVGMLLMGLAAVGE